MKTQKLKFCTPLQPVMKLSIKKARLPLSLILALSMTFTLSGLAKTTPLNSKEGLELLKESLNSNFAALSNYYETQKNLTYCGVASAVIVLNSIVKSEAPLAPKYYPYKYFTQNNIFTQSVLKIATPTQVNAQGLILKELSNVFKTYGLHVETYYVSSMNKENTIKILKSKINDPNSRVIMNYIREVEKQNNVGHFSPLAIYNVKKNKILVLDVARFRNYNMHWLDAEDVYNGMNTIDSGSKKSRGFIVVTKSDK